MVQSSSPSDNRMKSLQTILTSLWIVDAKNALKHGHWSAMAKWRKPSNIHREPSSESSGRLRKINAPLAILSTVYCICTFLKKYIGKNLKKNKILLATGSWKSEKLWHTHLLLPKSMDKKHTVFLYQGVFTVRKFTWWRNCLARCDEIFAHFPLFDETFTSHRALQ